MKDCKLQMVHPRDSNLTIDILFTNSCNNAAIPTHCNNFGQPLNHRSSEAPPFQPPKVSRRSSRVQTTDVLLQIQLWKDFCFQQKRNPDSSKIHARVSAVVMVPSCHKSGTKRKSLGLVDSIPCFQRSHLKSWKLNVNSNITLSLSLTWKYLLPITWKQLAV